MMYGARSPRSLRRLDVVQLPLAEHGCTHRSGDGRREDEPDHGDQRRVRAPERRQHRHGDDDQRQCEHGVENPADRVVGDTAEVARHEPDRRAADDC